MTEEHHDLEKDEMNIISGVLAFKKKTAEDVMTKFEDIYCLDIEAVLDFRTMRDIYDSGFSRIPVFEGEKQNIVGLLYVRDLAFVDADDETPLSSVLKFYKHEVRFVFNDIKLDEILQEFAEGKCHMAIVQKIVTETEGDPFYQVVGERVKQLLILSLYLRNSREYTLLCLCHDLVFDAKDLAPQRTEKKQKEVMLCTLRLNPWHFTIYLYIVPGVHNIEKDYNVNEKGRKEMRAYRHPSFHLTKEIGYVYKHEFLPPYLSSK